MKHGKSLSNLGVMFDCCLVGKSECYSQSSLDMSEEVSEVACSSRRQPQATALKKKKIYR